MRCSELSESCSICKTYSGEYEGRVVDAMMSGTSGAFRCTILPILNVPCISQQYQYVRSYGV